MEINGLKGDWQVGVACIRENGRCPSARKPYTLGQKLYEYHQPRPLTARDFQEEGTKGRQKIVLAQVCQAHGLSLGLLVMVLLPDTAWAQCSRTPLFLESLQMILGEVWGFFVCLFA